MALTPDQRRAKGRQDEADRTDRTRHDARVEAERDNVTLILVTHGNESDLALTGMARFRRARALVTPAEFKAGFDDLCHARGITHDLKAPKLKGQTTIREQGR